MTEHDEIRMQMAQIRHDLHKDVSGVRGGVEQVLDWKSLPRKYPYVSVVAALAAGYLLVPRRGHSLPGVQTASVQPLIQDAPPPSRSSRSFIPQALGFLWPIAEQAVQAYAAVWVESQIRQYLGQRSASTDGRPNNAAERRGNQNPIPYGKSGEPR